MHNSSMSAWNSPRRRVGSRLWNSPSHERRPVFYRKRRVNFWSSRVESGQPVNQIYLDSAGRIGFGFRLSQLSRVSSAFAALGIEPSIPRPGNKPRNHHLRWLRDVRPITSTKRRVVETLMQSNSLSRRPRSFHFGRNPRANGRGRRSRSRALIGEDGATRWRIQ